MITYSGVFPHPYTTSEDATTPRVPKFIMVHKGEATDMSAMTPEEGAAVMEKWGIWVGKVGAALSDIGAPFGPGTSVIDDGPSDHRFRRPATRSWRQPTWRKRRA